MNQHAREQLEATIRDGRLKDLWTAIETAMIGQVTEELIQTDTEARAVELWRESRAIVTVFDHLASMDSLATPEQAGATFTQRTAGARFEETARGLVHKLRDKQ